MAVQHPTFAGEADSMSRITSMAQVLERHRARPRKALSRETTGPEMRRYVGVVISLETMDRVAARAKYSPEGVALSARRPRPPRTTGAYPWLKTTSPSRPASASWPRVSASFSSRIGEEAWILSLWPGR